LIDTSATAASLFWTVFVAWGVLEWGESWAERRRIRQRGEAYPHQDKSTAQLLFAAIYGGMALAFLAAYEARWAAIGGPRWLWLGLGLGLIVVGIAVRQWAIHTLGRLFARRVRIQEAHTLITSGPYRVVRHPSYAGGLLSDAGLGLALGNWLSVVVVVGCILAAMVRRIAVEEDALRRGLGAGEYERYAVRTARLVPGIW
jgi:protein-S-isoprenylcysteine O-methyltransferase